MIKWRNTYSNLFKFWCERELKIGAVGRESGVIQQYKRSRVKCKLKGIIQKKENCGAGDSEKNNKSEIPEETKKMKFNEKVNWLAFDNWDLSRTLTEVRLNTSLIT